MSRSFAFTKWVALSQASVDEQTGLSMTCPKNTPENVPLQQDLNLNLQ